MLRTLWFLVKIVALVAAISYVAARPGEVTLLWQDWRLDTSLGALLGFILIVLVAAILLRDVFYTLLNMPGRWRQDRLKKREAKGMDALSQGLVAIAAGDGEEANLQARRAQRYLPNLPLRLLLSAQAAQLNGDKGAAHRYFTQLSHEPKLAFLGIRGLLGEAHAAQDRQEALKLARSAHHLQPKSAWVVQTLFKLQAENGLWEEASQSLRQIERQRIWLAPRIRRHRAALWLARARRLNQAGEDEAGAKLLRKAVKEERRFFPAALEYAGYLVVNRKTTRARRVLERAWAAQAAAPIAKAYMEWNSNLTPLKKLPLAEKLAKLSPQSVESSLLMAEAALDAELWGVAREHAQNAERLNQDGRSFELLARLARLERRFKDAEMLTHQAQNAPPPPAWICQECHQIHRDWQALCQNCDGFDTLAWQSPKQHLPLIAKRQSAALPLASGF